MAAAGLRTRVSWFLVQLGFMAFTLSWAPSLLGFLIGFSADVAWGPVTWWSIGQSVGVLLMLLGIRPTDAGAIRTASAILFGFVVFTALGVIWTAITSFYWPFFVVGGVSILCAAVLAPMLPCACCCHASIVKSPRATLRLLWVAARMASQTSILENMLFPEKRLRQRGSYFGSK